MIKRCNRCSIDKDDSLFNSHRWCKDCQKEYNRKYSQDNRKELSRKAKIYRNNNKDKVSLYNRTYRENNKEEVLNRTRKWIKENKERKAYIDKRYRENNKEVLSLLAKERYKENKEHRADYMKQWRKNSQDYLKEYNESHRGEILHKNNNRRANKLKRIPKYADLNAIKRIYKTSSIMSSFGKTKYHVDHIAPLQGKLVSGFHHEDNLQIVRSTDNLKKSNNFIPYAIHYKNGEEIKVFLK